MNRLPVSVRECGARGDGVADDTAPVQAALDRAAARGGGHVIFPDGRYRCGTLRIGAHTHVELRPGAVLQGSDNPADYPPRTGHAVGDRTGRHLLVVRGGGGVRIDGGGIIDGAGPAFWDPARPGPRRFLRAPT